MTASTADYLGDRLDDDVIVYRAFALESFRNRKKNRVEYRAYLLREEDIQDGISVGLTPEAAVKYLGTNEGYGHVRVGDIHALGNGLEVRIDKRDPQHAFICNLPYQKTSDKEREQARFLAGRIADKSTPDTCDRYPPPPPQP